MARKLFLFALATFFGGFAFAAATLTVMCAVVDPQPVALSLSWYATALVEVFASSAMWNVTPALRQVTVCGSFGM